MLDPQISALLAQFGFDPKIVEKMLTVAIYLTVISIVAAFPTGMIAKRKGRSVAWWVIMELCVPVVPLLVVWMLPGKKDTAHRESTSSKGSDHVR